MRQKENPKVIELLPPSWSDDAAGGEGGKGSLKQPDDVIDRGTIALGAYYTSRTNNTGKKPWKRRIAEFAAKARNVASKPRPLPAPDTEEPAPQYELLHELVKEV